MSSALTFTLEVYNGPLDLLLTLIQKNKIDIYEIPVAEITKQYMRELEKMQQMDMEITGEFLVMASQLLLMKSRALLPQREESEEEITPEQLRERLLEYQRIKETAQVLSQYQFSSAGNYFKAPEKIARAIPANGSIEPDKLFEAFVRVISRLEDKQPPTRESFSGIVGREKISLPDKIREVFQLVRSKKGTSFESVFQDASTKGEVITLFLALLHLIARGRVKMQEKGDSIMLKSGGKSDAE